ncbi:hypothetical protein CNR22_08665 [Sphingobacteriaceae bacterium]|nr:hypothetical protein CNR22_08665 [Sphingobacteriaceae bacterium]
MPAQKKLLFRNNFFSTQPLIFRSVYTSEYNYKSSKIPIMKRITNSLKALALIFVLASSNSSHAQILSPSFTQTVNAGGQVTFSSTTAGTSSITIFSWNFGDPVGYAGIQTSYDTINHTYAANGIYLVTLRIQNGPPTNTSAVTQTVVVNTSTNTGCSLNADFTSSLLNFGTVMLTNTSTGTTQATTYWINYGDGSPLANSYYYQYPYNGTFTISLTADNNYSPTCVSTKTAVVTVTNATCNVVPGFTFSNTSGPTFQFISTATAPANHICYWNFGDGSPTASGDTVTHTFSAQSGNYYVQQQVSGGGSCASYTTQEVSVSSASCVANSNFTFAPSGTPQWWNVFPTFPYNVSNAVWNWGDGNTSNSLYTSHLYASAGTYTICLSVTVTCGDTSSACSSYAVYKSTDGSSEMIGVTALEPGTTTGITPTEADVKQFVVYPNPGNGHLNILSNLTSKATIQVYSLIGKLVYSEEEASLNTQTHGVDLTRLDNGIYFLKVTEGSKISTEKIVITK